VAQQIELVKKSVPVTISKGLSPQGKQRADSRERKLLKLLGERLSEEEVHRLAAGALEALDKAGLDRLVARLGEETGRAVRRILECPTGDTRETLALAGTAKICQEWHRAWTDWDDCVAESGREHGKYVYQEHHWEEPVLDAASLAEDLEPIAARMRKLIPRMVDDDLDPDFSFAEAVEGTAQDVGAGLPDWMGGLEDGCPFGPEVTGCLLDWEWRSARRGGQGAFEFADRACKLEMTSDRVCLDDDAVAGFILDLGEADQRAILEGVVQNRRLSHWVRALEHTRSGWFRVYQALSRRRAPKRYVESCREAISQDWKFALPVIGKLLGAKRHQEARSVIEQALGSLLRLREGERWDPRETLLIDHPDLRYAHESPKSLGRLLQMWTKVAEALGEEEMAWALRVQAVLYPNWADGDVALEAFQAVPRPKFEDLAERLFSDWREMVAEASLGYEEEDEDNPPAPSWVPGLVDAARAGRAGPSMFRRTLRRWLSRLNREPALLMRSLGALGRLTLDLDTGSDLRRTSPKLLKLLTEQGEGHRALRASRGKWLKRLEARGLWPELMRFWKRHAAGLVPDPVDLDYHACADWLAAAGELDPGACKELLRRWSVAHRRRRSLWKTLGQRGFTV
jgi:hypothetical protein